MAISFPGSPSTGQKFTHGNKSWTWNGNSWIGTTTAGSDAATLGGISASSFLRSDASNTASGSYSFTHSYNEFGNATGSVANDGSWNARLNIAGSSHARFDVKSVSDGIITTMYSHSGHNAGKIGTYSNHQLKFIINGSDKAILSTSGSLSTTAQGTLWGASNDGSGSGLDADTLDGLHASDIGGGASDHPQGTLLTDDNGSITGSVSSTNDAGSLTGSVTSTDNFENVILTAFLNDGNISQTSTGVNATKTLAIHDGATGGGIEMLRNDLANLSTSMVNQSIQLMNIADQSPNDMIVIGSNASRVTLTETLVGHDMFTLEDSGNRLRCTKDVPANINIKLEAKIHANADYRFELWKNGVRQTGSDHYTQTGIHNTMTSYTTVSFNDTLEFRCHSYNGSVNTINISGGGFISLQLIGS